MASLMSTENAYKIIENKVINNVNGKEITFNKTKVKKKTNSHIEKKIL